MNIQPRRLRVALARLTAGPWRLLRAGRVAVTWAARKARGAGTRARSWAGGLRPEQHLILGFLSYALLGSALLSLPAARKGDDALIDNIFTSVSAVSTTGLSTISLCEHYTFFGQVVVLVLFQLGGIGYMTVSSVVVLARGGSLSQTRSGVLHAGFSIPRNFVPGRFLVHVVVFTLVAELTGSIVLWRRFDALGVPDPLWSGIFHAVSAFATAGFSLNADSLERFSGDWVVCTTIGTLCYLGAIGFIVVQDVWYSVRFRERMLTFTSRVILSMTLVIFGLGTLGVLALDDSLGELPAGQRALAAGFQVMSASTTAGFNTIPVASLATTSLVALSIAMIVGASPSGTGGGMKTTGVSALLATLVSILRRRDCVRWMGHEIPMLRVLAAVATAVLYLTLLLAGVLALSITERGSIERLAFEATSAIGTVGLSLGATGELSTPGKVIVIILMFAGRTGPMTLGLALLRPDPAPPTARLDDLAV